MGERGKEECFDLFGNVGHPIDFKESIEEFLKAGYFSAYDELLMPMIIEWLRKEGML
jgi:hypothetical protein